MPLAIAKRDWQLQLRAIGNCKIRLAMAKCYWQLQLHATAGTGNSLCTELESSNVSSPDGLGKSLLPVNSRVRRSKQRDYMPPSSSSRALTILGAIVASAGDEIVCAC